MIDGTLVKVDLFRNVSMSRAFRYSLPSVAATGALSSLFTASGGSQNISVATNGVSFQVGTKVTLTTVTTLPAPFALATPYYVVSYVDAGGGAATIKLSATQGGTAITATNTGVGNHTITTTAVSDVVRLGIIRPQGVIKFYRVASKAATQSTNYKLELFTASSASTNSADLIVSQAAINKAYSSSPNGDVYFSNHDIDTVISEPPTNAYLYAVITNSDAANYTGLVDLELVIEDC